MLVCVALKGDTWYCFSYLQYKYNVVILTAGDNEWSQTETVQKWACVSIFGENILHGGY